MMKTAIAAVLLAVPLCAAAQTWKVPAESQRCPSKWGAGDERGSMNHQKPAAVMNAAKLIKSGEMIELAHVLSAGMPFSGPRRFDVHTKRTFMNQFSNQRGSNEELVVTELGQVGTQFDGFAHQTHMDSWYNCFKVSENATRSGFTKLGIEKVGMIMTRGVLIDVAGLKGVDLLPTSYNITAEDLQQALVRQKLTLEPGDAVIIRTGWSKLVGKDHQRYGRANAGIGIAAGQWLVTQDPMLIAADNCCVEVRPSEPPHSLPVHSMMLIQHGIYLLENLVLEELAAANAHEFAFIVQPLKIKGGTGSAIAPIAIR